LNLLVRKATIGDASVMALLGRITFSETFGYLFQNHRSDLLAYLDATFGARKMARSLEKPRNAYWLAYADDLPVGYAKLKLLSGTPNLSHPDVAQLQKIYVLQDFLGQRIGRALLDAAMRQAREAGAPAVWLAVLRENEAAARFYEKQKFSNLADDIYTIGAQTFAFRLMVRYFPT
jgi:ribosomal protein S18 acetylase RimI-like enzyme